MAHIEQTSGLSDEARQALAADRKRLMAERERIEHLIGDIDRFLGNGVAKRWEGPPVRSTYNMREEIETVLRAHPGGLRPIEVTGILKKQGLTAPGATSLELLVSNHLWRMARDGVTRRVEKTGKYKLAAKGENDATSE